MSEKTVLLGFHDESVLRAYARLCKVCGYTPTKVDNQADMLERTTSEQYDVYVMDMNLDNPGRVKIGPAMQIYEIVKPRVLAGEARFLAVSAEDKAVELAKQNGLPAEVKGTRFDLTSILE